MATNNADTYFEMMIRVENKDIFVDLKKNRNGPYLKISERRNGSERNTVLIPASGIPKLRAVLDEVAKVSITETKTISKERKLRVAGNPDVTSRSVYVTGLLYETNEDEISKYFSSAGGEVVKAAVLRHRRRGISRSMGCGVVEFATPEMAAAAIEKFNDTELGGRQIKCREDRDPDVVYEDEDNYTNGNGEGATERPPRVVRERPTRKERIPDEDRVVDPTKVFVANISWESTEAELTTLFSSAGKVASAQVLSTKKGRAMGSGIVEFVEESSVQKAIDTLSGKDFSGRIIVVRPCYK